MFGVVVPGEVALVPRTDRSFNHFWPRWLAVVGAGAGYTWR
jgi:hypothetical protein